MSTATASDHYRARIDESARRVLRANVDQPLEFIRVYDALMSEMRWYRERDNVAAFDVLADFADRLVHSARIEDE